MLLALTFSNSLFSAFFLLHFFFFNMISSALFFFFFFFNSFAFRFNCILQISFKFRNGFRFIDFFFFSFENVLYNSIQIFFNTKLFFNCVFSFRIGKEMRVFCFVSTKYGFGDFFCFFVSEIVIHVYAQTEKIHNKLNKNLLSFSRKIIHYIYGY